LVDRCGKYLPQIIRESRYFLGRGAPHHYFAGQIEQESRCNEGITAFDGGQGLGQFMPRTAAAIHEEEAALRELGAVPLPYDPRWAIRALVLYDRRLYTQTTCPGWYFAFRAYNGGAALINREALRAGTCLQAGVERACQRKVLTLKSGARLDLCRVNIEYPQLIIRRSAGYVKIADDDYWSLSADRRVCADCHTPGEYRK
jgi:hypothetical protein